MLATTNTQYGWQSAVAVMTVNNETIWNRISVSDKLCSEIGEVKYYELSCLRSYHEIDYIPAHSLSGTYNRIATAIAFAWVSRPHSLAVVDYSHWLLRKSIIIIRRITVVVEEVYWCYLLRKRLLVRSFTPMCRPAFAYWMDIVVVGIVMLRQRRGE